MGIVAAEVRNSSMRAYTKNRAPRDYMPSRFGKPQKERTPRTNPKQAINRFREWIELNRKLGNVVRA